jgi:hypothetical protein
MKKYLIILSIILLGAVSVARAQDVSYSRDLSVGTTGTDVASLQVWLISNGFDIPAISSGAAAKGYFGTQTKMAVMKMQAANGIPNTGYVGPLTRGHLNKNNQGKSLTVTSPNGNETWVRGATQTITWTGAPGILNQTGSIKLQWPLPACADPANGPIRCMIAVRAPITLKSNIALSSGSYAWNVGSAENLIDCAVPSCIPEGKYKIQICSNDSSVCDTSDDYFTISSTNTTGKLPPAINGVNAPTTLAVNQVGTWTVSATDPQNGNLNYSVDWGDTPKVDVPYLNACPAGYTCAPQSVMSVQQGSTFTHSYSIAGTHTIKFTVTNSAGLSAQSTVTVMVNSGTSSQAPRVVAPTGGENWVANSNQTISWNVSGTNISKVDIYLDGTGCENRSNVISCEALLYTLDKNIDASKPYGWIAATDIANRQIPPGTYRVRVCESGSTTNCGSSAAPFTILGTTSAAPLRITSPNGGESWQLNQVQKITWTSPYYIRATYADLKLRFVGATCPAGSVCPSITMQSDQTIATGISINQNSYNWTVGSGLVSTIAGAGIPNATAQFTVGICEQGTTNCDWSDSPFTISTGGTLKAVTVI